MLEDLENPAPYYETIGEWAAKFHEQSRTWSKPYGFTRFNWDLSNMVGPAPRWGRWEKRQSHRRREAAVRHRAVEGHGRGDESAGTNETWGLIHADLRPSNVIRGNDGRLTVIDFDDAGYSWYLYDYASSL